MCTNTIERISVFLDQPFEISILPTTPFTESLPCKLKDAPWLHCCSLPTSEIRNSQMFLFHRGQLIIIYRVRLIKRSFVCNLLPLMADEKSLNEEKRAELWFILLRVRITSYLLANCHQIANNFHFHVDHGKVYQKQPWTLYVVDRSLKIDRPNSPPNYGDDCWSLWWFRLNLIL